MSKYIVNKETYNKRIKICKKCDHFFKLTGSCKKCGCFMHIKTRLSYAKCPIDKWSKEKKLNVDQEIPKEIIEEVIELWDNLKTGRAKNQDSKQKMIELWNVISGAGYNPNTNCSTCISSAFDGIRLIYKKYKK